MSSQYFDQNQRKLFARLKVLGPIKSWASDDNDDNNILINLLQYNVQVKIMLLKELAVKRSIKGIHRNWRTLSKNAVKYR